MGTALLEAWLQGSSAHANSNKFTFSACVRSQDSLRRLKEQIQKIPNASCNLGSGDEEAVRMANTADIILLGCGPTDLDAVLRINGMVNSLRGKIVISLLAGVSYKKLRTLWIANKGEEGHIRFVRVLPSLGAKIRESATIFVDTLDHQAMEPHVQTAKSLFSTIGTINHVGEELMDEVTALGAVCHALAIVAADTLADASAADGLARPMALDYFAQCMRSATGLLKSGVSPEEMKNSMAVPTGITINSILQLERTARFGIADSLRYAIAYAKSKSS
nr:pyrroline-5-carboxylate reductase [Quercus suber]